MEFKRALVALALEPGVSVARITREHGVNANQVFSWRLLYQQGSLGVPALMRDDGLVPEVLASTPPAPGKASADGDATGTIVRELGQVRVRIEGQLNAAVLAQVLDRVLQCSHWRPAPFSTR